MIHIEGMGWVGAVLAYRLDAEHIPFTWSDTDAPHVAWRAAIGLVPPPGHCPTAPSWGSLAPLLPDHTVTPVAFAGTHQGRLRVTGTGWAADVPAIVTAARTAFASRRVTVPHPSQPVVVAHGNTPRRAAWVWGWSAPVRLDLPDALTVPAAGKPLAIYTRHHRFSTTYACPIPTRPGWWQAGTAHLSQRRPRPLDADHHLRSWLDDVALLDPTVHVADIGPPVHGWSPKPRPGDPGGLLTQPRRVVLPPLCAGVKAIPTLVDQVARWCRRLLTGRSRP